MKAQLDNHNKPISERDITNCYTSKKGVSNDH